MATKWLSSLGRPALGLAAALAATLLVPLNADAFHVANRRVPAPGQPADAPDRLVAFATVVAFVERHGWPADLGRMCERFKQPQSRSECLFKQIAIDTTQDGLDNHGFNVPFKSGDAIGYVVIFHLRPLVGEFFAVSSDGDLIAALYRAKGIDYTPISNDEVRQAFASEVSFWRTSFTDLEQYFEGAQQPVAPRKGIQP